MALTQCLRVLNMSGYTEIYDWPLPSKTNQCIEDARLATSLFELMRSFLLFELMRTCLLRLPS